VVAGYKDYHWFYLKGRDYLNYSFKFKKCLVLIKPEFAATSDIWLMGDPFLRAYYSVYDMENKKIGFVGVAETIRNQKDKKATSVENKIVNGILEGLGLDTNDETSMNIIIIAAMVIIFIFVCSVVNYCIIKCRQSNIGKAEEETAEKIRQE
jgi:phage shock protein PspC (stress-responsive transcriptional regulator)